MEIWYNEIIKIAGGKNMNDARILLIGALVADWLLLPWFLKPLSLFFFFFSVLEVWRKRKLFYSHWIFKAFWYLCQVIALFVSWRGWVALIPFLFYYVSWLYVINTFKKEWIEEWCSESEHTILGVHRTGIPYLGYWIGELIPIWPWGRDTYYLSSDTKEITSKTFDREKEMQRIRGIDGGGERGKVLGVGMVRIRMAKGWTEETYVITILPQPEWVATYLRRYYIEPFEKKSSHKKEKKEKKEKKKNEKNDKNEKPLENIQIDNINVYVDNRKN